MAAAEHLGTLAALYPVILTEERTATRQAVVTWRGNYYSVLPELAAAKVILIHRLGTSHLDIASVDGSVVARHQRAANGLGATLRDGGHEVALNQAAMAGANMQEIKIKSGNNVDIVCRGDFFLQRRRCHDPPR